MLTLTEALKSGRLDDFVKQEEARGIGPVSRRKLRETIRKLAKQQLPEGRTSHSSSDDGSTEK